MNGFEREKKREGQRVRITDCNKASHFCVVTSELVGPCGEEVNRGTGEERLFGGVGET